MNEKWICSCGAECDGNFCIRCGSPRPVVNPQPKKKSKKLLFIMIGAAAAVVIAAALLVYFFVFAKNYTVNRYSVNTQTEVMEGFELLTDLDRDIALQYPAYLEASVQDNGSYIYGSGENEGCYIRISRDMGKTSPEKYFKKFQTMLKEEYPNLTFSSINEVKVEDKTLYMIMTNHPDMGPLQHYLELYPDYYVTYTSVGYENEGGVNTELYYAISSLKPDAYAYGMD